MDFSFQRNPKCCKISGCCCIKSNVCFQGYGKITENTLQTTKQQ